jgi:hypothetical protein
MKFTSKNIFKWSLLILVVLNSTISCKKIDLNASEAIENNSELKSRFFNTSSINDVEIKKLVNDIRKKDSIFKFLPDFVSKNGMPQWDKVLYKVNKKSKTANSFQNSSNNLDSSGTQGLFIIPFQSQNSPRIQSYITAYKHNDSLYTYRLYNKDTLNSLHPTTNSAKKDLMNSQAILGHFEKTVNNIDSIIIPRTSNSNFVLKNVNLGFTETNNASFTNNNPQSAWVCIYTTTIYLSYEVIVYIGPSVATIYYSGMIYMTTEVDCYDDGQPDPGSGSGWNPGNPNNGTGGNGNGSSWPSGGYQGGGGGPFYPWWGNTYDPNGGSGGFSPTVTTLKSLLGLSYEQSIWLEQNPTHATPLLNYLQTSSNSQATAFSITHLNLLMNSDLFGDFSYAMHVFMHSINGNPLLMWWEDDTFLLPFGGLNFGQWAMNYLTINPSQGFKTLYYSYLTEVENNLINPCLKSIINDIKAEGHKAVVFDLYKKSQSVPDFKIKFKYEEVASLPDNAPARTVESYTLNSQNYPSAGTMTIQLSTTALIGKSKEFITSVILHEICHSIIKSSNILNSGAPTLTQAEEHTRLINEKYILAIYDALKELYPNAPNATAAEIAAKDSDFKDLAIGGVADVLFDANGALLNNALTSKITAPDYFPNIDIANAYTNTIPAYKNLTKGTICN